MPRRPLDEQRPYNVEISSLQRVIARIAHDARATPEETAIIVANATNIVIALSNVQQRPVKQPT